MRLLTVEEAREIDSLAENELKIPLELLMENAGYGVAKVVDELIKTTAQSKRSFVSDDGEDSSLSLNILFLVGIGNNGADGLVAARHLIGLYGDTIKIHILVHGDQDKASSLFNLQKNCLDAMGQKLIAFTGVWTDAEKKLLDSADYIIDGLIGTGFKGDLRHDSRVLTHAANTANGIIIAIDVPTGLNADTGAVSDDGVVADYTVTMGAAKVGMFLYPGKKHCGKICIQPLGCPHDSLLQGFPKTLLGTKQLFKTMIPVRQPTAHKGTNGHVIIIGGSEGLLGAPLMTSYAAVRSGAGKTTLSVMEDVYSTIALRAEEAIMCNKLPRLDTELLTDNEYTDEINELLSDKDVLALGPGLGRTLQAESMVKKILALYAGPIVLDADGLFALGNDITPVMHRDIPVVLTPHVGEFSRLAGLSAKRIESNRVGVAREFAMRYKVVLVLKGAPTVTAYPDGTAIVNSSGNPGMGVGGMGDVLTGIIAALIGQGLFSEEAAAVGVYLHGLAADSLERNRLFGYLPKEVADSVPEQIKKIYGAKAEL